MSNFPCSEKCQQFYEDLYQVVRHMKLDFLTKSQSVAMATMISGRIHCHSSQGNG